MSKREFLNPEGVVDSQNIEKNIRPKSLKGLTIAFVDNTKPNFDIFCDKIQEILLKDYGVAEVKRYRKLGRTVGASQKDLDEIKATCDYAITGLGDCGSCTSWALRDCVEIERIGVPALCVTTTQYSYLARMEAAAFGLKNVQVLEVPHPLGAGVPKDEVEIKAINSMEILEKLITGQK